ncbi:MAG: hypothetical protein AVDCRST_MAG30-1902 [uncultured Solirubrobacteraceae bacterium]|uniref:Uncharacterized protein n=1 Tax=uncultured Solirubrobacteraceae bacterium TaxID=1162706 RepID=A0A6J4SJL4_9ACTN|nr:MAG: hypothetical protein AVDCRST_MAG30-1902 [uncultured Solirubrobacteraceae bacterium]
MSRKASNMVCTQRRLPGHCSTGTSPSAQRSCRPLSEDGNAASYLRL